MTTAEKKTAEVQVDLGDIIDADFEAFLDLLVAKAFYPYACAYDIDFDIVKAVDERTLLFRVAAFLDDDEDE